MSLVKVWTDTGGRKPQALLAKIIERDGVIITIKYLTEGKDKIWRYENDTYDIDDDQIAQNLNTSDETKIGYRTHEDGFLHSSETDEDYEPQDEDEEDEDDDDDDDDDDDEEEQTDEQEFEESSDDEEEDYVDE